jgi:hypothetical protein
VTPQPLPHSLTGLIIIIFEDKRRSENIKNISLSLSLLKNEKSFGYIIIIILLTLRKKKEKDTN